MIQDYQIFLTEYEEVKRLNDQDLTVDLSELQIKPQPYRYFTSSFFTDIREINRNCTLTILNNQAIKHAII
jgi:hypothetical protein